MTEDELRKELVQHIKNEYGTKTKAAKAWGCGLSFVSDVTTGRRGIPEWMLNKIGYERRIVRIMEIEK